MRTQPVLNTPEAWTDRALHKKTSWGAALWSQRGQEIRFQRALHHLNLGIGDRLLDFGCGTGALSEWLPYGVSYYGCDTSPGMVRRARNEHPERKFGGLLPQGETFTHTAAIGPWNLTDWEDAQEDLEMLWRITDKALVASLHRSLVSPPDLVELYPDCLLDLSYYDNDQMLVLRR